MALWPRTPPPGPRERPEAEGGPGWTLSPALAAAATVAVVCLAAAFVTARLELVLLAAPLLLTAVIGWSSRPGTAPVRAVVTLDGDEPDGRVRVDAVAEAEGGADGVHLRIRRADREPQDAVVTPRAARRLSFVEAASHSGPQRVLSLAARGIGPDAAWVGDPGSPVEAGRVVRPTTRRVRSLPLPARLLGLTGGHVSTRPGDGGEFRDIDRFRPGDRLRRIDWKATARLSQRPGELYVRRTTATSDAAVHLVVDARDDVPGAVAGWASPYPRPAATSLDLAREAAVSLAGAYAAAADRVGFDDLSDVRRSVPARAGDRHLSRVCRAIELTAAHGTATERARAPRLAPGAVVFVMSTLLDDQATRLALTWRAAGHRVIVVDVLPPRSVDGLVARERLALRVVDLERSLRLDRLRAAGAELLVWSSPDRDAVLRRIATTRGRP